MKPEPLKDKIGVIDSGEFNSKFIKQGATTLKVVVDSDIKSAVEWLKKYQNNPVVYFKDYPEQLEYFWEYVGENPKVMIVEETEILGNKFNEWLIDKAFEDVIREMNDFTGIKCEHCNEDIGTNNNCGYCKQFAEQQTLGEHK